MKSIFITATDTDAGKTFVSCALIHALKNSKHVPSNNIRVAAFKPVSAGCELIAGKLVNEDAKHLMHLANCHQSIDEVNPIAFQEPIAPHIAAKQQNSTITVEQITHFYQKVRAHQADVILIEGAGGWRLPLSSVNLTDKNPTNRNNSKPEFLSDFVKQSGCEVVLVVNMKLGCLNHALLTYQAILADGLVCIAWVANCAEQESMRNLNENIQELELLLPVPKIATIDYIASKDEAGRLLTFTDKISIAAKKINLTPLI
ncbi:dethiobiotin synthase [Colwelliaceae bacterium MEBiC 14330]